MEEDLSCLVCFDVGCAYCVGPCTTIRHVAVVCKSEAMRKFMIETLPFPVAGSVLVIRGIHFREIFLVEYH